LTWRGPSVLRATGHTQQAAPENPNTTACDDCRVSYRELAPPPELAHVVRCLWVRIGGADETVVVPDGCLDVVVRGGVAAVAGPDTGPVTVRLDAGEVVTGLRMHPGVGGAALGVPADALRDRRVALEDLWGRAGREAGERAKGDPVALAGVLHGRLTAAAPDPRVLAAARALARAPRTPVPALAAAVSLGERQLRRRFATAVGYGPKMFARVARFHHALALVRSGEPLAAAAVAAGYADQAHMTRELVALAGRTPGVLAYRRTVPSSANAQAGLWATSQAWPSGSWNAPE
jgi:AraC-like DNA-binding protein